MPRARPILGALALLLGGCPTPEYVYPPGAPQIAQFELVPSTVDAGDPITVRWRTRSAATIHLAGLDDAPRTVSAEGETTFTPSASGQVDLIAGSAGGERRARATFVVRSPRPVQVLALTAEPRLVRPGEAVTVRWHTQEASRIRVRTSEGVGLYDGDLARGGVTFRPQRGVEVTLVAEGFMGPVTSAVFVSTEEGLPFIHTFLADPPIASSRDAIRLAWLTSRASDVELYERIDEAWVSIATSPATSQTVWFPLETIAGTRTFRLEAKNATGSVFAEATSVVIGAREPTILALSATPAVTGFGGSVRVAWDVVEAAEVVLTYRGDLGDLPFSGARDLIVYSSGDITLTARDGFGGSTATSTAIVVDPLYPEVQQFSISPARVSRGDSVLIRTFVRNADSYALFTEDGTVVPHDDGTALWTPDRTTVLTLVATSSFGATLTRQRVAVNERPTIERFEIDDDVVRQNRPTRIRWSSSGGLTARLIIGGLGADVSPDEGTLHTALSGSGPTPLSFNLRAPSGSTETATASVLVLPAVFGAGAEMEPNGTAATAHLVDATFDPTVTGELLVDSSSVADVDWVAIDTRTSRRLQLTTAPSSAPCNGLVVTVFGEGAMGEPVGPFARFDEGDCPDIDAIDTPAIADLPRVALIRLERPAALAPHLPAFWELGITVQSRACGDGVVDRHETCDDGDTDDNDGCSAQCHVENLDEIEPNHSTANATPIAIGAPAVGAMAPEDRDVWVFEVLPGEEGVYRVDLAPEDGSCSIDAAMMLLDQFGGTLVDRSTTSGCVRLDGPFLVLDAGTYYVRIVPGVGGEGRARGLYRLTVTPPP